MTIHIEDLKFKCIIGILDFERVTEQELIINVLIKYKYTDIFIDYSEISKFIKSHMKKNKFLLIEDALASLGENLKEIFPLINIVNLKITKPSIMTDCKVSVSEIYRFDS